MGNVQYLMLKNEPVLSLEEYQCNIIDYDRLPYLLRYQDVNYEDFVFTWKQTRALNLGRSNVKQILNALGVSQRNILAIARLTHFASITDSYWVKEESENIRWEDVSLFRSNYSEIISSIALVGLSPEKITNYPRLHFTPPDTSLWGLSAKTIIKEDNGIWLYKVGRKEIAASQILDVLGFEHVKYEPVPLDKAKELANTERIEELYRNGECISKCRLISSEDRSIFTWEDYLTYCERNNKDPYEIIENYKNDYGQMQIADYILNNEDRHDANWGFYMDNTTGKIMGIHPLMDHDHAFSKEHNIYSQSSKERATLYEAAKSYAGNYTEQLNVLMDTKNPDHITNSEWDEVKLRASKIRPTLKHVDSPVVCEKKMSREENEAFERLNKLEQQRKNDHKL